MTNTTNSTIYVVSSYNKSTKHVNSNIIAFATREEADLYCQTWSTNNISFSPTPVAWGVWKPHTTTTKTQLSSLYGKMGNKIQTRGEELWSEFTKDDASDDASYWEKAYVPEETPKAYGFSEGLTMEEWVKKMGPRKTDAQMLKEKEDRAKEKAKLAAIPDNTSQAMSMGKSLWKIFQEEEEQNADLKLKKAIAKYQSPFKSEYDQFFNADDNLIEPDHIRQIRKVAKAAALRTKKAFAPRPDEPQIRMPKIKVDKKETKKRTKSIQALHDELTNAYPNDSFFEPRKP